MSKHFFIIGAQRSGSTYLYQILDEHPEIEMHKPVRPEPKFLKEGSADLVEEYLSTYFPNTDSSNLRGDKSTSYIESPSAAKRIASCFPDAKILVILRDPVDRAISNYWLSVAYHTEDKSIEEVLLDERLEQRSFDSQTFSVSPYVYLKRGKYVDHIDEYAQFFDKSQMRILVFEQFLTNLTEIQDLYKFLGVANDFIPESIQQKVNEGVMESEPPEKVVKFLTSYFQSSNEKLAQKYSVDIGSWRSARSIKNQR